VDRIRRAQLAGDGLLVGFREELRPEVGRDSAVTMQVPGRQPTA
jgi:hypothetical protein